MSAKDSTIEECTELTVDEGWHDPFPNTGMCHVRSDEQPPFITR